jgi:hypothetical protein
MSVEAATFNSATATKIILRPCRICHKPTAITVTIENQTVPVHDGDCITELAKKNWQHFEVQHQ